MLAPLVARVILEERVDALLPEIALAEAAAGAADRRVGEQVVVVLTQGDSATFS